MTEQRPAWAQRLQAEREARGWSKARMARELLRAANQSHGSVESLLRQIRGWEAGDHFPNQWSAAYANAFGIREADLFETPPHAPGHADEDRRQLLACLAMLGASRAVQSEALEPIRAALDKAADRTGSHLAEDWEDVAYEHGHAFVTTPPGALLPDLAADLVALQDSIRNAPTEAVRRRLCAPGGKLAALVAMTVSTLGDRRQARDWWVTARRTADASNDRDLRVWVRGYEAMNILYAQRAPGLLLRRAQEAMALAGDDLRCAAVMEAMAAQAQSFAQGGQRDEAESTVNAMVRRFEALPAAVADDRLSTKAWPETALRHAEAYVYTYTGNAAKAGRAIDAALSLYPAAMQRQRAQITLLRAVGMVQSGDVAGGLQHAQNVVQALSAGDRTTTIHRGAESVLAAVPAGEASRPAVAQYREQLALTAAP